MRRQISGRPDGSNPLIYTGSVPNMVTMPRRPTVQDGINWPLGYWWIIPKDLTFTTGEVWILVSVANAIATWKKLHGGGGPTPPTNTLLVNKIFLTTTGAGTYTPTTGMKQCYVECQGAGSGAGYNGSVGVGGSAGGYCAKLFTDTEIGTSQSYVVGAGGAGGIGAGTSASNGGNTTFGSFLTANGGSAATVGSSAKVSVGGTATGGDINLQGGYGSKAQSSGDFWTGSGGNSFLGMGALGYPAISFDMADSALGTGYGSAANGIAYSGASGGLWHPGQDGIIIITEYIG